MYVLRYEKELFDKRFNKIVTSLSKVEYVVFDEADYLFEMGF